MRLRDIGFGFLYRFEGKELVLRPNQPHGDTWACSVIGVVTERNLNVVHWDSCGFGEMSVLVDSDVTPILILVDREKNYFYGMMVEGFLREMAEITADRRVGRSGERKRFHLAVDSRNHRKIVDADWTHAGLHGRVKGQEVVMKVSASPTVTWEDYDAAFAMLKGDPPEQAAK